IELRMCANHLVDRVDSPVPKKRSHHCTAHVELFIHCPSVDQHNLSIRELNNRAIALPDVKECNSKKFPVKKHPDRPGPPQQSQYHAGACSQPEHRLASSLP